MKWYYDEYLRSFMILWQENPCLLMATLDVN